MIMCNMGMRALPDMYVLHTCQTYQAKPQYHVLQLIGNTSQDDSLHRVIIAELSTRAEMDSNFRYSDILNRFYLDILRTIDCIIKNLY